MTTINGLDNALFGITGTGAFVGSNAPSITNATLTTPILGTPQSGNLINCTNLPASALPAGSMFNFQQAQNTTGSSFTTTTWAVVSGLQVVITPTSASNQVLVRATIQVGSDGTNLQFWRLNRGATPIGVGTSVGSRTPVGAAYFPSLGDPNTMGTVTMEWLDSPASTSTLTYNVETQMDGAGTGYINQTVTDTNSAGFPRAASTISACEIVG